MFGQHQPNCQMICVVITFGFKFGGERVARAIANKVFQGSRFSGISYLEGADR